MEEKSYPNRAYLSEHTIPVASASSMIASIDCQEDRHLAADYDTNFKIVDLQCINDLVSPSACSNQSALFREACLSYSDGHMARS